MSSSMDGFAVWFLKLYRSIEITSLYIQKREHILERLVLL